jgi:D-alanine-D-alanine ligase
MTRVAVLAGGRSPEREVSLRSGHRVVAGLRSREHEAELVDPAETALVDRLDDLAPDVCYVALHGKEGEDGTVQRVLELLGLPYTGAQPSACEVAFDKVSAKERLHARGVPTPRWAAIQAAALRDLGGGALLHRAVDRVGLPAVVKPSRAGSAMGISFVDREADLPAAVMSGLSFSDAVVIERVIAGVEVAVGFVDGLGDLPLVEVVPRSGVFDYAARYTAGATEYYAPARLSPEVAAASRRAAARGFEALGMRDVSRADVLIDTDGSPWVVDVNVSPGMTDTSLLPMAAEADGVAFADLCERVMLLAVDRGSRREDGVAN